MGFIFPYKSKVLSVTVINHDVLTLKITRPWKFEFTVGQVVDLSIDKPGYELAVAPFTIANVPTDNYLEFIIKVYPTENGLTKGISELLANDTIQISKAWDSYKYNGSGTFIAAGTGITPFLPIFSDMEKKGIDVKSEHNLIYVNKTKEDILFYKRLKQLFSSKLSLILSRTNYRNHYFGKIDRDFLLKFIQNTEQKFYICGPKKFEENVKTHLITIGVKHDCIQTGHKF
tara:strand:- start:14491 stop:15180 length:690 start_codon:yes stop_codon:yes gene_type:complete